MDGVKRLGEEYLHVVRQNLQILENVSDENRGCIGMLHVDEVPFLRVSDVQDASNHIHQILDEVPISRVNHVETRLFDFVR